MKNEIFGMIVARQERVNVRFNGPEWRKIPAHKWMCAAHVEFAEFLEECEQDWVWWKPTNGKADYDKRLEELVDTIAFALSCVMIRYDTILPIVTRTEEDFELIKRVALFGGTPKGINPLERLSLCWNDLMSNMELRAFSIAFIKYIEAAKVYLDVTESTISTLRTSFVSRAVTWKLEIRKGLSDG
jgi:hypothetical protein